MIKQTVTFTDYNGNERTEDLYFNLSKAEIIEMEAHENGALEDKLQAIVDSKNIRDILETFTWILSKAIGQKSPDGKRFIKNDDIRDGFFQSEAYSEFLISLLGDSGKAAKFVAGLVPSDLLKEAIDKGLITNQELEKPEDLAQ